MIVDQARTMLLHAMHKWPDVITVELWPYALKLAADLQSAQCYSWHVSFWAIAGQNLCRYKK
jgi:hypothetical protein